MKPLLFLIFSFFHISFSAQIKRVATIGFYNVENLFDTIQSADYIDTSLPKNHINFHRSIPLDSLKYLEITKNYKGPWDYEKMKGKKIVRKQSLSEDFTPKSSKNYTYDIYQQKLKT